MPTRRDFLYGCSALAVAASVSPAGVLASQNASVDVPLHQIAFSDFAANARTTFKVRADSGRTVGLQLIKATLQAPSYGANSGSGDALNEKFSLLFTGPRDVPLPQNSCMFEHARLGRFTMFISPVGPKQADVCCYEACFNRPAAGRRMREIKPV